jgi:ADP-ribose pyrophosphatase YjhB (NUDIX family)
MHISGNARFYQEHDRFYVAVDCIIFGFDDEKLKILLIRRNFEPCKGQWSLMGGFLQQNENLDESAQRILTQLTGIHDVYLEQLYTYGEVHRDPAARVLSTAFYALIKIDGNDKARLDKHHAAWFDMDNIPDLVFDHSQMVDKAMKRLKRRSKIQPIGFELLPDKFTIPQLQNLYEAIYQKELDKRNFRRKILTMDFLDRLEEKDKGSSKKGAYLYKFNEEKYNYLVSKGYHFEV